MIKNNINNIEGWKIEYNKFADKLFFAKKIPSSARPKIVNEHIIVFSEGTKPFGIVIENFKYYYHNNKEYRIFFNFIEKKEEDIVLVPNVSEYTKLLTKYLFL